MSGRLRPSNAWERLWAGYLLAGLPLTLLAALVLNHEAAGLLFFSWLTSVLLVFVVINVISGSDRSNLGTFDRRTSPVKFSALQLLTVVGLLVFWLAYLFDW